MKFIVGLIMLTDRRTSIMFMRSFLVLGAFYCLVFPALADEQIEWTNEKILGLFPTVEEGWSAGDVKVEELQTITSDFESFAGAVAGSNIGASVRLRVSRKYSVAGRSRTITIDTEDINTASTVTALEQLAETGDASLEEFAAKGIQPATYLDVPSLRIEGERTGRVLRLTGSGIVALECDYPNCGDDLAGLIANLDVSAIKTFLVFDHRR